MDDTTKGTVAFPAGHFVKHCMHEYANASEALVREFVQNSIDAGASRLDIVANPDHIVVRDNGCGISRERMVEALLTMGGTDKMEGSVGGYGNAKVALLFAHAAYLIRTLDTVVSGRVLEYDMRKIGPGEAPVDGAEFTIWPAPEWGYDSSSFRSVVRDFLATCQLKAAVSLDGVLVSTRCTGRAIDLPFAYGRVLSRRFLNGERSTAILVRVNGITMFRQYVSELDRQVIVELAGDTRAMLTSNRDGLRYPYRGALEQVAQGIAIDRKSFDRKKAAEVVYRGNLSRHFESSVVIERALPDRLPVQSVQAIIHALAVAQQKSPEGRVRVAAVLSDMGIAGTLTVAEADRVDEAIREVVREHTFGTDFVVSIENTNYRQPPLRYTPGRMLLRHERTAKLWRHCVELVLKAGGISFAYRVGFVLDADKLASFSGDHRSGAVLINPDATAKVTRGRAEFLYVLQLAAHEIAHRDNRYHDEAFVGASERLFLAALTAAKPPSVEIKAALKVAL